MPFLQVSDPPGTAGFNWKRKIWHMTGILVPLIFYMDTFRFLDSVWMYPTRVIGLSVLAFGSLFLLAVDIIRLFYHEGLNLLFIRLIGPLMKEEEQHRFNGTTPYLIANTIMFSLLGDVPVTLACICLMIADPVAAYTGVRFGRLRFWNGKSLEGLLAFVFTSIAACLIFLVLHTALSESDRSMVLWNESAEVNWPLIGVVIAGSLVAGTAEFLSGNALRGLVDDNLIVPLAGAFAFAVLCYAAGFDPAGIFFDTACLFNPPAPVP